MADNKLEEQDIAGSRSRAGHGITTGRAARIAWHRARGLSMVSRVRGLGKVIAPWLWPMHLVLQGEIHTGDGICAGHGWCAASGDRSG